MHPVQLADISAIEMDIDPVHSRAQDPFLVKLRRGVGAFSENVKMRGKRYQT